MTSRTHITAADLEGMSPEQIALFDLAFGGEMEITQENMSIAMAARLNVFWLLRLVSAAALAEYYKATAAARAKFEKDVAAELDEHDKTMGAAWAKYANVKSAALVAALTYKEGKVA